MMLYWYPVGDSDDYARDMIPHQVQWMLTAARARVPGIPFIGVYQTFDGNLDSTSIPTAVQLHEWIEDFVREGACGLVSFLCAAQRNIRGWEAYEHMRPVLRTVHEEILTTGSLQVAPEPDSLQAAHIEPTMHWQTPKETPGIVPAWYIIGPFDDIDHKTLEAIFPPEQQIDLEGTYSGKNGPIRWVKRLSQAGVVGMGEIFGGQGQCNLPTRPAPSPAQWSNPYG